MSELKNLLITCDECGCVIEDNDERHDINGTTLCEDCFVDMYMICDYCGETVHRDDAYYHEGTNSICCPDCYHDNYTRCENCGDYVHNDDIHDSEDGYICTYCRDNYYRMCDDCGGVFHEDNIYYDDDDNALCRDCYNSKTKHIHSYDYKPTPVFFGNDSPLYMGVELEIDGGGEDSENAEKLIELDNDTHIYCKHDGSLHDGFEIVSHPCTLDYHEYSLSWRDILAQAVRMGYTSHDARTCGLHIHVSKKALGFDDAEIEQTTANILYFVERYWNKLLIFSRRTEDQLNRWASRYGHEGKPLEILEKSKKEYARYRAINLLPYHTIEFRLFRGTLNPTTFYATLELVERLCAYCRSCSEDKIMHDTWNDFLTTIDDDYENLISYLITKNIYTEE